MTEEEQYLRSARIFQSLTTGAPAQPLGTLLDLGILGYDESIVFSPQGASWMLKELAKGQEFYIFLDHFISEQMSKAATAAAHSGKGIYRPAEFGYRFADTYRQMGTLTHWAHAASPQYELSIENIDPEYLHI